MKIKDMIKIYTWWQVVEATGLYPEAVQDFSIVFEQIMRKYGFESCIMGDMYDMEEYEADADAIFKELEQQVKINRKMKRKNK